MPRRMTNLLGLAVLAYLEERPMHAYELHRQLIDRDAARTFRLSYGALYSVVRQLEATDLITASGVDRAGRLPERTTYQVTDEGRAESRRWLSRLIAEPQHEYPAFAAALSLIIVLPPDDARALLEARLERLAREGASLAEQREAVLAGGVHPVFLVEDEYRERLLDAESGFIRTLLDRIDSPDAGWVEPWRAYHRKAPGPGAPENPDTTGEPS
ncbi:PadR family transcriptional regulator [Occultella glacieicola]|uniref:PadR family transcriptional regulator n=1 Tax=Occultella glacieicola TaxID=2518684 RepID=A0ABY2EAQ6_9MICO|nr:PadR family transcriptional regulator [Occultella glacieicola]TDE97304.1 PadR family transcriptional regulator [Occultella glacieicola]